MEFDKVLYTVIIGTALDQLLDGSAHEDLEIGVWSDSDDDDMMRDICCNSADSDSRATAINTYQPPKRDIQTHKTYNKAHIVDSTSPTKTFSSTRPFRYSATEPISTDGDQRDKR
jgi:hypothetical protein